MRAAIFELEVLERAVDQRVIGLGQTLFEHRALQALRAGKKQRFEGCAHAIEVVERGRRRGGRAAKGGLRGAAGVAISVRFGRRRGAGGLLGVAFRHQPSTMVSGSSRDWLTSTILITARSI